MTTGNVSSAAFIIKNMQTGNISSRKTDTGSQFKDVINSLNDTIVTPIQMYIQYGIT